MRFLCVRKYNFLNAQKSIFGKKMTKEALGPCTWVAAYVCGPKHAYVGILLRTQLGFQKHIKGKFSAIIAEV